MRKKVFLLLSFVLALAVSIGVLTACGGGKKVTVDNMPETLTLVVGGSGKTLPATASDGKGLTWSSDIEGVATVSNAGRVTPVACGTATITATAVST
ncbi:MAG: Ig-like domain-containing protein, partial [Clostridia bacterium]|nr:Ig-like domain-containing protein [Clostridia bacterium]